MEIFVFLKLLCVMNGLIDRNKKEENKMSKLSSVLKKTGIAVAAAAMLVTMGAGTVVTQAKQVCRFIKYRWQRSIPITRKTNGWKPA